MKKNQLATKTVFSLFAIILIILFMVYKKQSQTEKMAIFQLDKVTKTLVSEPFAAKQLVTSTNHRDTIKITLKTEEKVVANESSISALKINGQLAGPIQVVYQHQRVIIDHINPNTSQHTHYLKINGQGDHSVPAMKLETAPGSRKEAVFMTTQPGVYLYRVLPKNLLVSERLINSASGALIVLPKKGLVDPSGHSIKFSKAYFINEQNFYVSSNLKQTNHGLLKTLKSMRKVWIAGRNKRDQKSGLTSHKTNLHRLKDETLLLVYARPDQQTRMQILGSSDEKIVNPLTQRDNANIAKLETNSLQAARSEDSITNEF